MEERLGHLLTAIEEALEPSKTALRAGCLRTPRGEVDEELDELAQRRTARDSDVGHDAIDLDRESRHQRQVACRLVAHDLEEVQTGVAGSAHREGVERRADGLREIARRVENPGVVKDSRRPVDAAREGADDDVGDRAEEGLEARLDALGRLVESQLGGREQCKGLLERSICSGASRSRSLRCSTCSVGLTTRTTERYVGLVEVAYGIQDLRCSANTGRTCFRGLSTGPVER